MHPAISDIQTSTLLYYDCEFAEQCFQFCLQRDIDYLPSIDDPSSAYHLNKSPRGFTEVEIDSAQKVDGQVRIFHPALLDRFAAQPLLFVYDDEYLTGVVHFSDYNRPTVSAYLYQTLFDYETALRELLVLHRFTDQSMLQYLAQRKASATTKEYKGNGNGKSGESDRKVLPITKGPPFEQFYLRNLVHFICDQNIISIDKCVLKLRNGVMHAHHHVELDAEGVGYAVYDRNSFAEFFQSCLALHRDLKRVRNRIAYLRSGVTGVDPLVTTRSFVSASD